MIRAAEAVDDDVLWAMLEPVFRAGETYCLPRDIARAEALAFWHAGHEVFVAGDGLGTYYVGPNQKGGGAHVCNCGFVTAPSAQGQGVARAMLEHALAHARCRGFCAMQFNFVIETNARAIALWDAYGFETVGRLPKAFQTPQGSFVDARVMYLHL